MRSLTAAVRSSAASSAARPQQISSPLPRLLGSTKKPCTPVRCRRSHQGLACASAASGTYPDESGSGAAPKSSLRNPPVAFSQLESLVAQSFGGGGPGGDWKQVDECWVLYPPNEAPPKVLVHFVGGAFVGAAPQLAYRPLLEALAARGALVVTTPHATSFDHIREADGVYFRFQRCLKSLGPSAVALPQFGVGHSLGSLLHLLINSRYVAPCAGNVFMSFNNRPATDSIPLLSPFIAPSLRALGPILSQLATSPLRSNIEANIDILKGLSPPLVKQLVPILEQLTPIYLDIANGTQEFNPPPEQTRGIIRQGYMVPRNLLLRFSDDTIDQTPELASTLQSSAIYNSLELTVKTLSGDHVRPLQQDLNQISPELVRVANQAVAQGNDFLGQLSAFATRSGISPEAEQQLAGFTKAAMGVANMVNGAVLDTKAAETIELLADELASWMGLPTKAAQKVMVLPPPAPTSPTSGPSSPPPAGSEPTPGMP